MRLYFAIALLVIFLLTVSPVFADEAEDYINNEVAEWTQVAEGNGFEVLETYIGSVTSVPVIYTYDLGPGTYRFYMSGGLNISDLDCYAYDEDGYEVASDAESDKIPIIKFNLDDRATIDFEITSWAFNEGFNSGFFCIVATTEDDGEIHSFTGDEVEDFPESDVDFNDMDFYNMEAQATIDNWIIYEDEIGNEVYDSGVVLADSVGYPMEMELEPGFYQVYAQPDSRCIDLDMCVYDADGNYLSSDYLDDNLPICEFMTLGDGVVVINFEVYEMIEGAVETCIGYVIVRMGGTGSEDRMKYIEDKLFYLQDTYVYEGITVYEKGYYEISKDHNWYIYEIELDAGSYYAEAQGGIAVTNLDMYVYDEGGNLMNEDTLDDNFPIVSFEISELQTVEFRIHALSFAEGFDEDFFAWILIDDEYYYDYDDYDYDEYLHYDDESLMLGLETQQARWNKVIENHGEDVLVNVTESIHMGVNDNRWSMDYTFDEGIYYLYGQGDGLSLIDIDIYVYGEDGEPLYEDSATDNSPMVKLVVGPSGVTYTIEVHGYDCYGESGFFNLMITKAVEPISDPLEYIENELADWCTTADNQMYDILGEYVGTVCAGFEDGMICAGTETWTMELTEGFYVFYASGGAFVQDLDLSIYTSDGKPLGSDTRADNIPLVRIYINETTEVELEFTACTYVAGSEEGYFCLLVATDSGGEILDFSGDTL